MTTSVVEYVVGFCIGLAIYAAVMLVTTYIVRTIKRRKAK